MAPKTATAAVAAKARVKSKRHCHRQTVKRQSSVRFQPSDKTVQLKKQGVSENEIKAMTNPSDAAKHQHLPHRLSAWRSCCILLLRRLREQGRRHAAHH